MKKALALVLSLLLCFSASALTDEEQRQENNDATVQRLKDAGLLDDMEEEEESGEWLQEYAEKYASDNAAKDEICIAAIEAIQKYQSVLYDSSLNDIVVNPNMGTDKSGDFIALVYMAYNTMTESKPSNDKDMIVRVSNTIASAIAKSCPSVVEVAIFWELPKYDSQAKVHFIRNGNDFQYGDDAMFPKSMI